MKRNDARCPVCLAEWNMEVIMQAGHKRCPHCHTNIMPMKIAEDVMIRLNWQDLRVLAIYGKRWTTFFDLTIKSDQDALKAFNRLVEKIMLHQPPGSLPLTIEGEMVQVEIPKGNDTEMLKRIDNTIPSMKPDADGNIPSPFFSRGHQ